jgi:hypothetical protein
MRKLSPEGATLGSILAAGALIAACGVAPVGTVDVEGTVQARVSATVGAASRVQAAVTPTRPAGATAVTTIAVPTTLASPSPARTPDVTPNPTVAAAASATARATGSPAATTSAAGSPTSIGAAAAGTRSPAAATSGAGTPAATGTPVPAATPVSLGTFARLAGLSATVSRYEWGLECPSGEGRPRPASKFVTLRIALRNDTGAVLVVPAVQWAVEGYLASAGAQAPCRPDEQQLGNACLRTGQLAAGARCEGWLLFEVPESLDVPGSIVQARADAAGRPEIATWRLPGA